MGAEPHSAGSSEVGQVMVATPLATVMAVVHESEAGVEAESVAVHVTTVLAVMPLTCTRANRSKSKTASEMLGGVNSEGRSQQRQTASRLSPPGRSSVLRRRCQCTTTEGPGPD